MSTLDCFAFLRPPPRDEFEDAVQVLIDRISVTTGLHRFPFVLKSQQIRLQRFG